MESQRIRYERGLAYLGTPGQQRALRRAVRHGAGHRARVPRSGQGSAGLGDAGGDGRIAEALVATAVGLLVAIPRSPPTTCSCATWKLRWHRAAPSAIAFSPTSRLSVPLRPPPARESNGCQRPPPGAHHRHQRHAVGGHHVGVAHHLHAHRPPHRRQVIEVQLPKAAQASDVNPTTLAITLTREGRMYLNGVQTAPMLYAPRSKPRWPRMPRLR